MAVCEGCGAVVEEGQALCADCRKLRALDIANTTWKKQMRFYGILIAVGIVLLVATIPQYWRITGDFPMPLFALTVFGGLAFLGGLFGMSLAVFFHLWHGRSR